MVNITENVPQGPLKLASINPEYIMYACSHDTKKQTS
jgi:hypothetical protein